MKKPEQIEVRHLFEELYSELIEILQKLSADEWNYPTSNSKWCVRDIVAHLIDTDLRRLSYQRDHMRPPEPSKKIENTTHLIEYLNYLNNSWIDVSKRLSPNLLIDLLKYIKAEIPKLYYSLNMNGKALFPVWWAGEEESKCWFDIAREYTEKWYHQQQIREALGVSLLVEQKWIHPLLDTYIRGLVPIIYQKSFPNRENVSLLLEVEDIFNGKWTIKKQASWALFVGEEAECSSKIITNADTLWRMFTINISRDEAKKRILFEGDIELGEGILG
jgi:hypothetical protein